MVKKLVLLASIGYSVALIIVSFINLHGVPSLGSGIDDKVYHAIAYFLFAFLWTTYFKSPAKKYRVLSIIIISSLFGIIIESLQHQLNPNRIFDLFDIVANCIGVVLGTLIANTLNILKLK